MTISKNIENTAAVYHSVGETVRRFGLPRSRDRELRGLIRLLACVGPMRFGWTAKWQSTPRRKGVFSLEKLSIGVCLGVRLTWRQVWDTHSRAQLKGHDGDEVRGLSNYIRADHIEQYIIGMAPHIIMHGIPACIMDIIMFVRSFSMSI